MYQFLIPQINLHTEYWQNIDIAIEKVSVSGAKNSRQYIIRLKSITNLIWIEETAKIHKNRPDKRSNNSKQMNSSTLTHPYSLFAEKSQPNHLKRVGLCSVDFQFYLTVHKVKGYSASKTRRLYHWSHCTSFQQS